MALQKVGSDWRADHLTQALYCEKDNSYQIGPFTHKHKIDE